jgi:hypothetical protein
VDSEYIMLASAGDASDAALATRMEQNKKRITGSLNPGSNVMQR